MSIETNVALGPLHERLSWLSFRQRALFASDECGGSGPGVREPDRILVIEDDLLIATQIRSVLSEAGFDIVGIATTGAEAIEMARTYTPDLAIVDIRLAGDRDGIDTALELFRLQGIRCLFASAYSEDREARQRAEPASPLGWLQKPYSMVSLKHMVQTAASDLRANRRQ
jgi:DNA-binding NarL/FixJ family response regulator